MASDATAIREIRTEWSVAWPSILRWHRERMPMPPSLTVLSNVAFRAASVAQAAICHAIYTKQTDPVIPLSEMIFATVAAACSGPFPDPRQLDLTIGLVEPQLGGDKIRPLWMFLLATRPTPLR